MKAFLRDIDLPHEPCRIAAAADSQNRVAFLESSQRGSPLGRHSILTWDPFGRFTASDEESVLEWNGRTERWVVSPLEGLRRALAVVRRGETVSHDVPAAGGAFGYFSYDLNRTIERVPDLSRDDLRMPLIDLSFYDWSLVYDHLREAWKLGVWGEGVKVWEERAARLAALAASAHDIGALPDAPSADLVADTSADDYRDAVRRALTHIVDGDIYQVNLAVRFRVPWSGKPFDLFRRLRHFTPSRYGAYLDMGSTQIISASPELFLRRVAERVQTRPIKGTRRRTGDTERDAERLADLLSSAKERAELSMIVDLERNDLGRVCEYGSVEVSDHAYIDELPTVFHTVSTVDGRLRPDVDAAALLRATFPGGSITGAPKIRAMSIIEELEPVRRGPYTGAFGCLGFDGDLSLALAIRTIVLSGGEASFHAGSGIVAESDPDAEYEEVLDKARALILAVGGTP